MPTATAPQINFVRSLVGKATAYAASLPAEQASILTGIIDSLAPTVAAIEAGDPDGKAAASRIIETLKPLTEAVAQALPPVPEVELGTYRHADGRTAVVRLNKARTGRYAIIDGEYVPGGTAIIATDARWTRQAAAPAPVEVAPGYYIVGTGTTAEVVRIVPNKAGTGTYGKTSRHGKFIYDSGAKARVIASGCVRLTVEEAEALSLHLGFCCLCGRTLTVEESVKAGIGPVCRRKL